MDRHRKLAVVGHLALDRPEADGQVSRSRYVLSELVRALGEPSIRTIDTSTVQSRPLSLARQLGRAALRGDDFVVMLAQRGLALLLPVCLTVARMRRRALHYVVIGGWLGDELARRRWLAWVVRRCDAVYVQTLGLKDELERGGLDNVRYFPNFRRFDTASLSSGAPVGSPMAPEHRFRLVYLARVSRKKGIDVAIESLRLANDLSESRTITLDIYGPIMESDESWFQDALRQSAAPVTYCGAISPEDVNRVLGGYDCMIFPTRYTTEGFPGSILDALIAGLPIIGSRWRFADEILVDGVNALLCEAGDTIQVRDQILRLASDSDLQFEMSSANAKLAAAFHADRVMPTLIAQLRRVPTGKETKGL